MRQRRLQLGCAVLLLLSVCSASVGQDKAIDFDAALGTVPADVKSPQRYALVIGANDYVDEQIPDLAACENDAKALHALLVDPKIGLFPRDNVKVLTGKQVTKRNIIDALDQLARRAGPDDLVLIFFSGHGATDNRSRAYWVMHDTEVSKLRATALPESDVTELIGEIRTKRLVTFIDACYSASTANVSQAKALIELGKVYPKFEGEGRVAITASRGDQLSVVIRDKQHPGFGYSAFAWHLLGALRGEADVNADGVITVDETWAYVKDRTERTSRLQGGLQQPQLKGQLGSRFLLTVDAERLIRAARESEAERKLRALRLAGLKTMALSGAVSVEHYKLGVRLLNARVETLDKYDKQRLAEFVAVFEGRIKPNKLSRALALIDAVAPKRSAAPNSPLRPTTPDPPIAPKPKGRWIDPGKYEPPDVKVGYQHSVVVTFDEPYDHWVLGGTGRYMVFQFKKSKKLGVIDLTTAKTVYTLNDVPGEALYAAGAKHIVIVLPTQRLVNLYSIETGEHLKVAPLTCKGTPHRVLLGSNSDGPALIAARDVQLIDLKTLEPIESRKEGLIGAAGRYGYHLSVSADGRTFGGVLEGLGPVAYDYMCITGDTTRRAQFGSVTHRIRWAQPSADGSLLFLPESSLVTGHPRATRAEDVGKARLFPTVDPAFFIAVRFVPVEGEPGRNGSEFEVYTTADRRPIGTLLYKGDMAPSSHSNTRARAAKERALMHDTRQRFHYIPWADLIVTLRNDNRKIHLTRFDLLDLYKQSGTDYLWIVSSPPLRVRPGASLDYQIKVKSSSGGVVYELSRGPAGMKVSPNGRLTWDVPQGLAEDKVRVLVWIKDNSGKGVFHNFEVDIDKPKVEPPSRDEKPSASQGANRPDATGTARLPVQPAAPSRNGPISPSPKDNNLDIHIKPMGAIRPTQVDPQFNIPRPDLAARPGARLTRHNNAWAVVRVFNRGKRDIKRLRLRIETQLPGGPRQSQLIDPLLGLGKLKANGGATQFEVNFKDAPANAPATGTVVLRTSVTDIEYAD